VKGRKNIKKRKKSLNIVHVISVVFIAYFGFTFFNQQLKLNKYNSQIELYTKEIESKQNLVEYYNNKNENISSDEYIESVAREKLGLVKPYEVVYVDSNK
jgi:cell division protein FtsB